MFVVSSPPFKPEEFDSVCISYSIGVYVNNREVESYSGEICYDEYAKYYSLGLVSYDKNWLLNNLAQGRNVVRISLKHFRAEFYSKDGKSKIYNSSNRDLIVFVLDKMGGEIYCRRSSYGGWKL